MTEALDTLEISPQPVDIRPSRAGVVTFLDVLGWKGIYNREAAPIVKLANLVRDLEAANLRYRGSKSLTEIRSISDTIVIYSTDVETKDAGRVVDMHGEICAKAIAASIAARIPVRGATAFGEFEVQGSIYVGKAIDEAASWYESSDWIGVHLTPSAMFTVDESLDHWTEYQPPLKGGAKHKTPCVNWMKAWKEAVSEQDPKRQLQSVFLRMGPITPDFAMKFVNTLAYFDEMLKLQTAAMNSDITAPPQ